jgi:hypothetical protein
MVWKLAGETGEQRKSASVPLFSLQFAQDLTWDRNQAVKAIVDCCIYKLGNVQEAQQFLFIAKTIRLVESEHLHETFFSSGKYVRIQLETHPESYARLGFRVKHRLI